MPITLDSTCLRSNFVLTNAGPISTYGCPKASYVVAIGLLVSAFTVPLSAWSPGTSDPLAVKNFSVNTSNRTDVLAFYNTVYIASQTYPSDIEWTGNMPRYSRNDQRHVPAGRPVAASIFIEPSLRSASGVTFNAGNNANDQLAALMFSANDAISHFRPPADRLFIRRRHRRRAFRYCHRHLRPRFRSMPT